MDACKSRWEFKTPVNTETSGNHSIEPQSTPLTHLVPVKFWISKRVRATEEGGREAGSWEKGEGNGSAVEGI